MIYNFSDFGRGAFKLISKSLIFALLLTSLLTNGGVSAQTNFTREQFSRLNVRTRAGFFENEILRAAQIEGVDPNILWTIAYNETRFRPWLTSPKDARGLMQFIPVTAVRFGLSNPYEPVSAIRAAARYVKVLSNLFGGRIDSILAAYNSGEGTVSAYLYGRTLRDGRKIINPKGIKIIGGVPPYTETITYVGRGLKIYRWLILRGAFPAETVRATFPTVISAMVARVGVFDRELGNVPDFRNVISLPQTNQNQVVAVNSMVIETNKVEEKQNANESTSTEVYYDSRTGSRYLLNNGKREKLADSGVVVINQTTRPETTNQARSTFFAVSSNR
ncbi:MAG TPA: lytic transglycosylase domain-containing protein [Pyrinomonadaceae bacterium]|nr:lytic transglycosylase domain-containing protein [Pyrinomonadaceae bacterium]